MIKDKHTDKIIANNIYGFENLKDIVLDLAMNSHRPLSYSKDQSKDSIIACINRFSYSKDNGIINIIPESSKKYKEHNTPYYIHYVGIKNDYVVINPILKKYNFQSVVAPEQAFQQIQQFLTNELDGFAPTSKRYKGTEIIPQISNKDMIASKGFDKFSFRKEKRNDK